ncbi:c-type cytochrome [Noviherbaspirillum sp. ST9]|uniref:c-type cytochrome n=1 Tax=Noviherbaspirillum sp. ST9 TaxID=3401606 RepID=UPI003B58AE5A
MTKHTMLAGQTLLSATSLLILGLTSMSPAVAAAPGDKGHKAMSPAAIYHNYCSVCHGDRGDGNSRAKGSMVPPPKDFTNPGVAYALTREQMVNAVANGKSGTAMTPWKSQLTQKEIEGVVDYVRNTFMPAATSDSNNRGRKIYAEYCSVCHGERGNGKSRASGSLMPPPRDFTNAAAKAELSRERMIKSVTYGRPETAMVGWKSQLSEKDILAVVDYVRTGFMESSNVSDISGTTSGNRGHLPATQAPAPQVAAAAPAPAAKPAAPVNMNAPMPKSLKGDAAKGAAFYMSNCSTCHGATGDGRGPRAYFINPKPRNFQHDASRAELSRPAIFKAVTEGKLGTEMPAWGKVMTDQEIADVTEFVFTRFIKSTDTAKASK